MDGSQSTYVATLLLEDSTTNLTTFPFSSSLGHSMMLMENVQYVSPRPTLLLSIINIVHSVFFFLFVDRGHCATLCKCRQVQQREITCGNNIKRNAKIRMFPRERCQPLISWPLQALWAARACLSGSCCLQCFPWGKIRSGLIWDGVEVFKLSAEIS